MAYFEKGNKLGNKFTSENQPKNNGRKPSLYKQLRKITGKKVGFELGKDDYLNIIRWAMEQNSRTLKDLLKDADGKVNKDTPVWLLNIISAINTDIKYGKTSTVEMLFDRVFGKPTQPIESEVNVMNSVDLSVLTTEELMQYNALLEKIRNGTK